MTFREQVRWCRKWGTILLATSLLLLATFMILASEKKENWVLNLGVFSTAALGVAIMLLAFGGMGRPVQKLLYHYAIEGNDRYRLQMAWNPIMRWWLWIDQNGRDKDA